MPNTALVYTTVSTHFPTPPHLSLPCPLAQDTLPRSSNSTVNTNSHRI